VTISDEMVVAQRRLLALRAKTQAERQSRTADSRPFSTATGLANPSVPPDKSPTAVISHELRNGCAELARRRSGADGRPVVSLTLFDTPVAPPPVESIPFVDSQPPTLNPQPPTPHSQLPTDSIVRVWPALAVALADEEMAPLYRFYVACQSIDPDGRRAFTVAHLRQMFTTKRNGRYLFSWRRMRQIFAAGEGKLWEQAGERIYLRSIARIAHLVGVRHIGRGVELPARFVFAGQGVFNAHLHAAWLAANGDEARPISQAAIEGATAVPGRTQRHYNQVAGVRRQKNLLIGERATEERTEEEVWRHGHNSFVFVDYQGQRGRPGGCYQARRLPDSYQRRHKLASNGRRRKIDKQLNSLVNHEERGTPFNRFARLYFANGQDAAKAAGRQPGRGVFWPEQGGEAGPWSVWHEVCLS
jgi:hypothetical protein